MNFFVDNTFSRHLARALALVGGAEGHAFLHLLDRYDDKDPGDLKWLTDLGRAAGDWIILSGDRRISTNPQRRVALATSRRVAYFMPSGFPGLDRWAQAAWLFKAFPAIARSAKKARPQQIFSIRQNGLIELLGG